jgi:glutamate-5-semialdehyde dehydrogenase
MSDPLHREAITLASAAREAGLQLAAINSAARTSAILAIAAGLRAAEVEVLRANQLDLDDAAKNNLAAPMQKRLALDAKKLDAMARAVEDIAAQPDPIGQTLDQHTRSDGLKIEKRRVPIGSVLFCYESRPNVTTDAAALCLRSGNAVILRGGKEARHTNQVIAKIIREAMSKNGLPAHAVQVVESTDRELLYKLLKQDRYIDLVIPRGGESLIRAVVDEATMPVLKHFTGNCHVYVDQAAPELDKVLQVIVNAKTSYPGGAVCNAVEHLLIHESQKALVLPICEALSKKDVEIRGDSHVTQLFSHAKPATPDDWDAEYLAFIVGIKLVNSLDEAISHINRHGSHHTDAILSTDARAIDAFIKRVDSASIMVNASTRLADGGEFGLGAEIGISTDKLHARGPMGAADLCTYKWVVTGNGHLR